MRSDSVFEFHFEGQSGWSRKYVKAIPIINRYQRKQKHMSQYNCMTLRIDPQLDEMITNASYDKQVSKTDWIRSAIRLKLSNTQTRHSTKRSNDQVAFNGGNDFNGE